MVKSTTRLGCFQLTYTGAEVGLRFQKQWWALEWVQEVTEAGAVSELPIACVLEPPQVQR